MESSSTAIEEQIDDGEDSNASNLSDSVNNLSNTDHEQGRNLYLM